MKYLVFALASLSAHAQERAPMVDGIDPNSVVQSVQFTGRPGYIAEAAVVRNGEGQELSLVVVEHKLNDARNYLAIDNDKLGLTVDGMAGTESSLAVSDSGSLLINQQNESVGRNRWSRTLTVAFREGKYLVAGFTLSERDTLDPNAGGSCDYNLLSGRGVRDLKKVKVSTKALDLAKLEDTEKLYTCQGW